MRLPNFFTSAFCAFCAAHCPQITSSCPPLPASSIKALSFALSLAWLGAAAAGVGVGLFFIAGIELALEGAMRPYWANAPTTKQRQNRTAPHRKMTLDVFFINIVGLKGALSASEISHPDTTLDVNTIQSLILPA